LDLNFIGLLNSLPSGAALVVGVPMGILADRLGRRQALLIGLSCATLFSFLLVTTEERYMMVILSAALGVANSLYFLSMAPFMMQTSSEKERTLLFSLNFGLMTISGSVGNLLAGQLPAWFGQWLGVGAESAAAYQAVLVTSVIGGGLGLLPIWFTHEARSITLRPRLRPQVSDLRALFSPLVVKLSLPNILIGFGAATLIPYLALFFKNKFITTDDQLGLLFSLAATATGVATVIGPRLAERLDSKVKAIVWTQGASVLFLLLIGFAPWGGLAGFAFITRSALMNMSNPLYSAFAMEHTPENERAAVNSIMQLMWEVGWSVGPFLSGVVQARYGFSPLFISTAALYFTATILMWIFFRRMELTPVSAPVLEPVPATLVDELGLPSMEKQLAQRE